MAKKVIIHSIVPAWVKHNWDRVLLLFVLGVFFLLIPGQNVYTSFTEKGTPVLRLLPFAAPTPNPYPINTSGYFPGSEISASGVVIYDVKSGVTLYSKNSDEELSPASTTKIMTALVALEHFTLDDIVTVKTVLTDGQVMGLVPGEQITVENLLYGALIHSGNDAAWAIAEHYPGGEPAFIEEMNAKAKALHLEHTKFTNPVGYDDPNHKMTAHDLAELAAYALTDKTITKIVGIPQITISDVTHTYYHPLTNVNQLLGKIPGVAGIKTGWTEEAGENLVTLVERDGHRVIIVVLKSVDRFSDTINLISWVFANHKWEDLEEGTGNR